MSILKAKVALIRNQNKKKQQSASSKKRSAKDLNLREDSDFSYEDYLQEEVMSSHSAASSHSDVRHTPSNNIMKNYCRGIANFAVSRMAVPYLKPTLERHAMELEDFRKAILAKKSKINCIKQLREMLLVTEKDSKEMVAIKNIFKEISIVFLKYFTPNWVFHSKISDKLAHLKYRFKILRRVKNPVYFTYLQDFNF